jgi:folylpolyglutamate synthase/dihydropteroate synthase
MGDTKKTANKSRRWFLSGGLSDKDSKQMVKMLTADGKLVEIERSVLDAVTKKQRSSNKEILDWMENPSKEKL